MEYTTIFGDMNGPLAYFGPDAADDSPRGATPLRFHHKAEPVFGDVSGPLSYWGPVRSTGMSSLSRRIAA